MAGVAGDVVLVPESLALPPPRPSPAADAGASCEGGGRTAGIRAAVVVSGERRCAKAHPMAGFTYRVAGEVYVNGVVEWVLSLRGLFAAPTPSLPHGGGSRTAGDFALAVCGRTPTLRRAPHKMRSHFAWELNHGGGSRAVVIGENPPPLQGEARSGGGSKSAGGRAAVVVSDGRRCAKAHPMVFFTYA